MAPAATANLTPRFEGVGDGKSILLAQQDEAQTMVILFQDIQHIEII
jgi:hypothetical protein